MAGKPHSITSDNAAVAGASVAFVVLWSSGFLTARLIAPHADPLTFLAIRYACAIAVLTALALAARAPLPRGQALLDTAVAGLLLHGVYLSCVFWAVAHGLPAGVMGLLSGLQPLLTAMVALPVLGERVTGRQWAGIGLGLVGVALVLAPKIAAPAADISPWAIPVGILAVVAITAGTIWQKKRGATGDLRTMTLVQYAAALAPTAILAAATEDMRFDMTAASVAGLGWAVLAISVGAIFLLLWLIRRGALSRVTSLLYLVPAVTAVMAWLMFDEVLVPLQIVGIGLTCAGVALTTLVRKPPRPIATG